MEAIHEALAQPVQGVKAEAHCALLVPGVELPLDIGQGCILVPQMRKDFIILFLN